MRIVEPNAEQARVVAEELLEGARVQRHRARPGLPRARAHRPDRRGRLRHGATSKNLYAATLAKLLGVRFTIAVVDDPASVAVLERAGVDVVVNPRMVTAEEIVRFAHDPRIRQMAMLEGDRFEILDITVREDSRARRHRRSGSCRMTGSLIGAIVRGGNAIFPHGDDMLLPGRPGDPLHRGGARRPGRAGALEDACRNARSRPAARPRGRLGVDLGRHVST